MNEHLNHIHFTIAILISLIIHITFVIYGNFNVNNDGFNKSKSDIELIIIDKPEIKPVVIESPSTPIKKEIIEAKPNKEIIFKEEIIKKTYPQESIRVEKSLQEKKIKTLLPATKETLQITKDTLPATKETLQITKDTLPVTKEETKVISTSELISNLGNLELTPRKKLNTNRIKTISARTKDYEYRLYFEAWRQKVERIGALNYPESAKAGNLGSLRLTVSLNKEGKIKEIVINKTSGNKKLDEAAIKIVRLGEPYAAFSPKMQKEVDLINITRTWKFTEDSYSSN